MRRLICLPILAVALVPPVWVAFFYASEFVPVGILSFSPDGRVLATLCFPPSRLSPRRATELRVWDLATGRERRSERLAIPDPLLVVADGGERLVAAAADGGTRPLADLLRWPERLLIEPWARGPAAALR